MNKEISLEQIISDVVMFFDRNKKLIISFTFIAVLAVFLFQKLKPAFYETSSIATSGISAYERIPEDEDVLNQRTAINLINNLQLDVDKQDYKSIAVKLNVTSEIAASVKFIEAEQLLRQDKDEKFHNTPKFQINLLIRNSEYILDIQNGLKYYFDENNYVKRYKSEFNTSNDMMIIQIDDEISELKSLRQKENINMNMSSFRVLSRAEDNEIQNQIIDLANLKNLINTQNLISSLDYVKDFTKTEVAERKVVVWGSAIGFIAFIISIIIAIIIEVKQKAKKN
ncbi:MAG: hypothetical protein HOH88_04705 [Flavobacteriales bacterium]|nr:hypothetical protein [Flavobacteriales bacterium]